MTGPTIRQAESSTGLNGAELLSSLHSELVRIHRTEEFNNWALQQPLVGALLGEESLARLTRVQERAWEQDPAITRWCGRQVLIRVTHEEGVHVGVDRKLADDEARVRVSRGNYRLPQGTAFTGVIDPETPPSLFRTGFLIITNPQEVMPDDNQEGLGFRTTEQSFSIDDQPVGEVRIEGIFGYDQTPASTPDDAIRYDVNPRAHISIDAITYQQ